MDLKAILLFIFSAVPLIAELTGSKRRWLVICLAFSMSLSGVFVLLGLIEVVASPRSIWRRIVKGWQELSWGSSYRLFNGLRRLEGKNMTYCHQGYDTTTYCTHKKHLVRSTMAPSQSSGRVDLPAEKVRKLQITYHVDNETPDQPPLTATERLKVRRSSKPVAGNKVTYLVDAEPDAGGSIMSIEVMKIKRVFKIGELTVAFRFAPDRSEELKATKIAINIEGVLQDLKMYKPTWGFREAWRFISYLAYWEKRDCCGVLLTYPYERLHFKYFAMIVAGIPVFIPGFAILPIMVLNICTVQDLIKLAEGHELLTIFRTECSCMAEGKYYPSFRNKNLEHYEGQNSPIVEKNQVAAREIPIASAI